MSNLTADFVRFGYDSSETVIDGLSLDLQPGEVLALLGGNGSGKTTLLRLLAGQLSPQNGQIILDSKPIDSWSRLEIAQRLTLMPQHENCESGFSVREMVQLGRVSHRGWWLPFTAEDDLAVDEALQSTGLADLQNKSIQTLSGGQFRRAILARSLAQQASIMLLDEPTSGLDLEHQFECLDQIRSLAREKQLIAVISMHDLNHAAMYADRVAVLDRGSLRALGSPADVFSEALIHETFGVRVVVTTHPLHGTPLVIPAGKSPER